MTFLKARTLIATTSMLVALPPQSAHAATLDGAAMPWPFALPFAGLLLSIALGPLLFPKLWHTHYGKIAAAWSLLTLVSIGWFAGGAVAFSTFVHAMLAEYLSFIVLLFTLLCRWYFARKFGGVTGDSIGAVSEMNEALTLLLFVFVMSGR